MFTKVASKLSIALIVVAVAISNTHGDEHTSSDSQILHQEEADKRAETAALKIIGNMPRFGGKTKMDEDDLKGKRTTYWDGIVMLAFFPGHLAVLGLFIAPLWACCRVCECCCCKKRDPIPNISTLQIYGPYTWVLSCMIAIMYVSVMKRILKKSIDNIHSL